MCNLVKEIAHYQDVEVSVLKNTIYMVLVQFSMQFVQITSQVQPQNTA
jgi:hypothetical protein